MIISMNGRYVEEREAMVSVYDHGFLYGIGLFETFRTYEGHPYLLEHHLRRLEQGCAQLSIHYRRAAEEVRQTVEELLRRNGLRDGYFRYTVTAGQDLLGLPSGRYEQPSLIMYVKALPPLPPSLYDQGKTLQLLRLPRNTPEGNVRLKSLHYMNNILGKRELQQYPWAVDSGAEGLFLDQRGFVAEGIVSNVFWVAGRELRTSSLETGILPGVTRHAVMALAGQAGLVIREGLYDWEDLKRADEVFLTNSIQEIVPVRSVYDPAGCLAKIGDGAPGPWTKRLLASYREDARPAGDKG